MNNTKSVKYPYIKQFIKDEGLPKSHHLVKTLAKGEAFELEQIEYFLSTFSDLPGFETKKCDLANPSRKDEKEIWINYRVISSEITAAYILQKSLALRIKGFNQSRPGYTKDCDILALLNGKDTYFEVKTRSGEQKRRTEIKICCDSIEQSWRFESDLWEDIEKWIFEEGRCNDKGEAIIPQKVEAEQKGADYLMCLVNPFYSTGQHFDDFVRYVFDDLHKEGEKVYLYRSKEEKLGNQLSGIILFLPCGRFVVVNNKNKISGNFIT